MHMSEETFCKVSTYIQKKTSTNETLCKVSAYTQKRPIQKRPMPMNQSEETLCAVSAYIQKRHIQKRPCATWVRIYKRDLHNTHLSHAFPPDLCKRDLCQKIKKRPCPRWVDKYERDLDLDLYIKETYNYINQKKPCARWGRIYKRDFYSKEDL